MKEWGKKYAIYLAACLSSVIVSLIIFAWQQPVDPDAFIYFAAAKAYLQGGFHAAMAVYPVPFYSILLALLAKTFHISFLSANYSLDVFFDTLVVLAFVRILSQLGATKRELFFGLFFILFFPYLAHFRHMPMRDHGYLAFALWALSFLIDYYREGKGRQSFFWGFFIILSVLFRVEGGILLVFAPLAMLFNKEAGFFVRLKRLFGAYFIPISTFIFIIVFLFFKKHQLNSEMLNFYFGRMLEIKSAIWGGFMTPYYNLVNKAGMIKPIVADNQLSLAFVFLISGLAGVYLKHLLNLLPTLYFLFGVVGLFYLSCIKKQKGMAVVFIFILINLIVSFGALSQWFFLSKRYVLLLAILLLLGAPFSFNELICRWRNRSGYVFGSRWFFPLVVLWMFIIALSSLVYFGPSKAGAVKAGNWLHDNISPSEVLCQNDGQLNFYANIEHSIFLDINTMSGDQLKICDYFAVAVWRHDKITDEKLAKIIEQTPIKIFSNRRGGKVIIYKFNHE
jgi:hypothetical protein